MKRERERVEERLHPTRWTSHTLFHREKGHGEKVKREKSPTPSALRNRLLPAAVSFPISTRIKTPLSQGGTIVGSPLAGRVLVIDDVITAGTAAREAAAIITSNGAQLGGLLIALDRQERGAETPLSAVEQVEQDLGVPVSRKKTQKHNLNIGSILRGPNW